MCNFAPSTLKSWVLFVTMFVLGFALIPILLVLAMLYAGCGCGCACGGGLIYLSFRINWALGILMFPIGVALIAVNFVLGVALAAIGSAIVILPIYFLHIYIFLRATLWWCRPRIKTLTKKKKNNEVSQI